MDSNTKTTKRIGDKDTTREEVKELLPIMQAFAEGKTIEICYDREWRDLIIDSPKFDCEPSCYRVKPEPKYRPFKSQEDCWNEMQKHQPFGWIKSPKGELFCIDRVTDEGIAYKHSTCQFYEYLEANYTFADNTPFGIKEG